MNTSTLKRNDFQLITDWVPPKSSVLDLGCGDGVLLKMLHTQKQVSGYGLELNANCIPNCINNNVNVIQMNLDKGLPGFEDNSFDYVILSLTLQSVKRPDILLKEMLRVGKTGIVSFPNFGNWRIRSQLLLKGKMPISKSLPHKWFDTPNIHLCTVKDFENYCHTHNIKIIDSAFLDKNRKPNSLAKNLPNLFTNIAVYKIGPH